MVGNIYTSKTAIFLDRDGLINETVDRGENCVVQGKKVRFTAPWKFSEFKFKAGVGEALNRLKEAGFLLILVSNQPDLSYGTLSSRDHGLIMAEVKKMPLDDIFICPHGRNDGCTCKKPKPGMILEAAKKWGIDLGESYVVGDSVVDIQAGQSAGCRTILTGDLSVAVDIIFSHKI